MPGKRDLSDMVAVLKFSGHWTKVGRLHTLFWLFQHGRSLYIAVLEPFALYSVYLAGVEGLYKYAFFCIAGILMSYHAVYFVTAENRVVDVVEKWKNLFDKRSEEWQIKIFVEESTPLWRIVRLYLAICATFMFFYSIAPILYDFCLALFTDKEPFSLPTPAEAFVGKRPTRSFTYYLVYSSASIWCAFLTLHSTGTEIMAFVFTTYLCVELKILKKLIENLGEDIEKGDKGYREKLREIVKEHQDCIRLAKDVNDLLGAPLVAQNVISTLTLTLLMFTALVQFRNGNFHIVLGSIFPLNCFVIMLYSICFVGEKLQICSLDIFEAVYDLPWYKLPAEGQKDINMMVRQSRKPMVIDYRDDNAINLATFSAVMNQSYSYLMVLQSMN